jgi:mRNA-degrading endonuclease RelE of RelBE toxin-antitoxin system
MAKGVLWSTEARADLRAIDRDTALRLLKSLDRFLKTGAGNVKQLEDFEPPLFRLRIGAWRIIYRWHADGVMEVVRVRNRREAYR